MLPQGMVIYLAMAPVDLRAGFDRLSGIVAEKLHHDPRGGALYLFTNRRRTHVKCLFYDRTGYAVLFKRLDRGKVVLPTVITPGASNVEISSRELELLLQGIDLPRQIPAPRRQGPTNVH